MDKPTLLVRQIGSGAWIEPESSSYTDEAHLQELLASDPTRIPGIPPGSVAVRELLTSSGPIDICIVSPSGAITVVECKLNKNSEPRRLVIGQVLDYASALQTDGFGAFQNSWRAKNGPDLDQVLDHVGIATLKANLTLGAINLCLAVDAIDEDLRRLIEYLYLISKDSIEVTALQLSYARHGTLEILIPSTFGTEIAHSKSSNRPQSTEKWTWETFVSAISDEREKELANNLKSCLDAVPATGSHEKLWFGAKPRGGIFFHIHGERYAPFQVTINNSGNFVLAANWNWWPSLKNDSKFAKLAACLGQDHTGSSARVLVSDIDVDEFWRVAVECDKMINS